MEFRFRRVLRGVWRDSRPLQSQNLHLWCARKSQAEFWALGTLPRLLLRFRARNRGRRRGCRLRSGALELRIGVDDARWCRARKRFFR